MNKVGVSITLFKQPEIALGLILLEVHVLSIPYFNKITGHLRRFLKLHGFYHRNILPL